MSVGTLNETKYAKLLSRARPHVIHNDKELEHFTEVLLELDELDKPSLEEAELAELLGTLIETYESNHYSLRSATPTEVIAFLMEQRSLSAKDLVPVVGSKGTASDIINGKRQIGVAVAARLGEFFHVAPELFIDFSAHAAAAAPTKAYAAGSSMGD